MRTKALQDNLVGFYFVANIISESKSLATTRLVSASDPRIVGLSLAIGVLLLLAILARYCSTRAEVSWHVRYADRSTLNDAGISADWQHTDELGTFSSSAGVPLHKRSIYDNWLVIRFTIAFIGLA